MSCTGRVFLAKISNVFRRGEGVGLLYPGEVLQPYNTQSLATGGFRGCCFSKLITAMEGERSWFQMIITDQICDKKMLRLSLGNNRQALSILM